MPPTEVDWSPEMANSVNLIGNLGSDPQVSYLPSGRVVAKFSIAVSAYGNKTNWFDCEMWNQVARSAQMYLQKGSKVHVRGRLEKDTWNDRITGDPRTRMKIVVSNFSNVRAYVPMGTSVPQEGYRQEGIVTQSSNPNLVQQEGRTAEEKWNDFFSKPDQYWDNRALKASGERSPKYPDFKHKTTQEALWIDSWDSPKWIQAILSQMDDAKNSGHGVEPMEESAGDGGVMAQFEEGSGFDHSSDGAKQDLPPQW
eukprot:CAMPEP_0170175076 /NCGR_PEP_ID=MMETSP0040_2-20121228/8212_1 /TAXON_ID=641309 /ORGANISM="Lotharella oceanica, Strain CCMP622" /LENGTH=253 /DNA_ID=CAMNT_0010416937 /DNA_START=272 /DNA_END=1030 /DNA_ORIENTATION=+